MKRGEALVLVLVLEPNVGEETSSVSGTTEYLSNTARSSSCVRLD
jgi:hypothetical protein